MKTEQIRHQLQELRTGIINAIKSEADRFDGSEIMLSEVDYNDMNGVDRSITSYISENNEVEYDYGDVIEPIENINDVHVLLDILSQLENTDND